MSFFTLPVTFHSERFNFAFLLKQHDNGKPVERRGRKASGLQANAYDSGAAECAISDRELFSVELIYTGYIRHSGKSGAACPPLFLTPFCRCFDAWLSAMAVMEYKAEAGVGMQDTIEDSTSEQHDILPDYMDIDLKVFPKGSTIYREGDLNNCFYIVIAGLVGVYKDEVSDTVPVPCTIQRGEFFGETMSPNGLPQAMSAVALQCSVVGIVKRH